MTAGFSCWAVAMMVSTRFLGKHPNLVGGEPEALRSRAICCVDSSPVTYNTGAYALMAASA